MATVATLITIQLRCDRAIVAIALLICFSTPFTQSSVRREISPMICGEPNRSASDGRAGVPL